MTKGDRNSNNKKAIDRMSPGFQISKRKPGAKFYLVIAPGHSILPMNQELL